MVTLHVTAVDMGSTVTQIRGCAVIMMHTRMLKMTQYMTVHNPKLLHLLNNDATNCN